MSLSASIDSLTSAFQELKTQVISEKEQVAAALSELAGLVAAQAAQIQELLAQVAAKEVAEEEAVARVDALTAALQSQISAIGDIYNTPQPETPVSE